MVRLLRRFLVVAALMFWQGGFTFYASVVVPIGAEVLGSDADQGFITRRVTNWLNIAGVAALAIVAWDIAASGKDVRWRWWLRWTAWLMAVVTLLVLLDLHQRLDSLIDADEFRNHHREEFRGHHRVYLWTSTVQWGAMVVWLFLSLVAWRAEDKIEG
jgi:hypothetical protein